MNIRMYISIYKYTYKKKYLIDIDIYTYMIDIDIYTYI